MFLQRLNRALFTMIAHRLLALGLYDAAQAFYVRVLNMEPLSKQRARAYAGLAQTEYHRSHFLNARHYAAQYLNIVENESMQRQTPTERALFDKVSWYHEASEKEYANIRRRS